MTYIAMRKEWFKENEILDLQDFLIPYNLRHKSDKLAVYYHLQC